MGLAFIKTCAYAPFPVWVYLNGHEWAKRKAETAGLAPDDRACRAGCSRARRLWLIIPPG